MMLADLGAEVTALDRLDADRARDGADVMMRGKHRLRADLRHPDVVATLLTSLANIDVVLEGFRPGVAERLGLGPDAALAAQPRLVYGRMTGYGQDTSWSKVAGHDIDFIAMSSALAHLGTTRRPVPPLNLVGDFGGGAMFLVAGVLAAVIEVGRSGVGQIVDAAMTDGSALLMASVYGLRAAGMWTDDREDNMTDGGAPYYGCYETADGRWIAIGALDARHWDSVLRVCGLDPAEQPARDDRATWPATRSTLAEVFASRDRREWEAAFAGIDASFAPVLTMGEAWEHPFHRERGTFPVIDGVRQPASAPRFSRTPGSAGVSMSIPPAEVLRTLGVSEAAASELIRRGVVA
jgi:alpha-methylacyl-CoA racemase